MPLCLSGLQDCGSSNVNAFGVAGTAGYLVSGWLDTSCASIQWTSCSCQQACSCQHPADTIRMRPRLGAQGCSLPAACPPLPAGTHQLRRLL